MSPSSNTIFEKKSHLLFKQKTKLMPICQCDLPDLLPPFGELTFSSTRFVMTCRKADRRWRPLARARQTMFLLWVLISYTLLIRTVTCRNGEGSALEPSQELELQCLQRDEDGEVHAASHPVDNRLKKIQTKSGYTLRS